MKTLVVLCHGLRGSRRDWDAMQQALECEPNLLVHASVTNEWELTYQGVDVCGARLAGEVRDLAARHEGQLTHISLLGHSMGGLIARYAAGVLFEPATGTMAGLQPRTYASISTPHLGCGSSDPVEAACPLWRGRWYMQLLHTLVDRHLVPAPFLHRSLRQLLALDGWRPDGAPGSTGRRGSGGGDGEDLPPGRSSEGGGAHGEAQQQQQQQEGQKERLLDAMLRDWPRQGLHFWSGLAAFQRRFAYSARGGDPLISWVSALLLAPEELQEQAPGLPPAAWLSHVSISEATAAGAAAANAAAAACTAAAAAGDAVGTADQGGGCEGGDLLGEAEVALLVPRQGGRADVFARAASGGSSSDVGPDCSIPGSRSLSSSDQAAGAAAAPVGKGVSGGAADGTAASAAALGGEGGCGPAGREAAGPLASRLQKLATLEWRRYDVVFPRLLTGSLHVHMIADRRVDGVGMPVLLHLAEQVAAA